MKTLVNYHPQNSQFSSSEGSINGLDRNNNKIVNPSSSDSNSSNVSVSSSSLSLLQLYQSPTVSNDENHEPYNDNKIKNLQILGVLQANVNKSKLSSSNNDLTHSNKVSVNNSSGAVNSWKMSITNSINFLKSHRGHSRPEVFSNIENNKRTGSVDLTNLLKANSEEEILLHNKVYIQTIGQIEPATNNKSSWDILCKIINCKMAFKKQFNGKKYNWIQLAGHAGRFRPGDREGFILKSMDELERNCLEILQSDILSSFVPTIDRTFNENGDKKYFTEMQDLLYGFQNPCIMDIKIGVRTFLENDSDEKETKPRNDLYLKLIELAPNEPTAEEHLTKAITKRRYMTWREMSTCSATMGFRIEAIKKSHVSEKEFYSVKEKKEVYTHIKNYTENKKNTIEMYKERLVSLRGTLQNSKFFNTHELIGSSLLFVHDDKKANIWMIDFGKTRPLPGLLRITHRDRWVEGNHEDGYLIGIQNLIDIFTEMLLN